jgi:ribonucleoside-triphosphate reductase
MELGAWFNSNKLSLNDTLTDDMKHGTQSFGFIGFIDILFAMAEKHRGEPDFSKSMD